MTEFVRGYALLAILVLMAEPALAQQFERTAAQPIRPIEGYLAGAEIEVPTYLAPPPAEGSAQDALDVATVRVLQKSTSAERWKLAEADARYVYPQFEDAFGGAIDRQHVPRLTQLLDEANADVSMPVFAAKSTFPRARPYQRWQLVRLCGVTRAPAPQPNPQERSSYPSGHAAYGWTTALVLAQVDPQRAPQVLARGRDYGLSRVICGAHFPSDVVAGQLLASATVARLATTRAFQLDLACAKAEHAGAPTPADCSPLESSSPPESAGGQQ